MPRSERPVRRRLARTDLPAELTPETLRGLGFGVLRQLAHPGNGVLDAAEQQQFDAALAEVVRGTTQRVDEAVRRAPRGGPGSFDPELRRSYERVQQRLADQARRARESFPALAVDAPDGPDPAEPDASTDGAPTTAAVDDGSPSTLEQEVEQTSDTLDLLERIASLQAQQVEHQRSQLLTETRGVFFAFLVSVAVLVDGIAALVEAEPEKRLLIALWTASVVAAAGLVYALVRWRQRTR